MAHDDPSDPYGLQRFVDAQDAEGTFGRALAEIRAGRKASHWIWFVFPQLAGLGASPTARRFALRSLDEARAYLRHPVLGPRLVECATAAAGVERGTAEEVFGPVDAMKLRSSATLFMRADPDVPAFRAVLDRYFDGRADPRTDDLLGGAGRVS